MDQITPMMKAVLSIDGNAGRLKELLAEGEDPNESASDGYTALHLAAMADWCEETDGRMQLLLEAGARTEARANTQGGTRWTPLHLAAAEGHASQVRMLIAWGADVEAADGLGRTPLMLAVSQMLESDAKVSALVNAGAKVDKKSLEGKTAIDYAVEYQTTLETALNDASGTGRLHLQQTLEIWPGVIRRLQMGKRQIKD